MTVSTLLILYICLRLKQFSGDFLLQTDWMALTKGKPGREGYQALFSHAGVHAGLTLLIMLVMFPSFWWLALVDFVVHSFVDRIKGVFTLKKALKTNDKLFWWTFGLDQELHNFTHLAYIILIATQLGGISFS